MMESTSDGDVNHIHPMEESLVPVADSISPPGSTVDEPSKTKSFADMADDLYGHSSRRSTTLSVQKNTRSFADVAASNHEVLNTDDSDGVFQPVRKRTRQAKSPIRKLLVPEELCVILTATKGTIGRLNPNAVQKHIMECCGAFKSLRSRGDNAVKVTVSTLQAANKLLKMTDLCGVKIEANPLGPLAKPRATIKNVDRIWTNDAIADALKHLGVKEAYRHSTEEEDGSTTLKNSVVLTFSSLPLPASVLIAGEEHKITPYVTCPFLCANCLRFGHQDLGCRRQSRCMNCGDSHLTKDCTSSNIQCANCRGPHKADYKRCSTRLHFFAIKKRQELALYGIDLSTGHRRQWNRRGAKMIRGRSGSQGSRSRQNRNPPRKNDDPPEECDPVYDESKVSPGRKAKKNRSRSQSTVRSDNNRQRKQQSAPTVNFAPQSLPPCTRNAKSKKGESKVNKPQPSTSMQDWRDFLKEKTSVPKKTSISKNSSSRTQQPSTTIKSKIPTTAKAVSETPRNTEDVPPDMDTDDCGEQQSIETPIEPVDCLQQEPPITSSRADKDTKDVVITRIIVSLLGLLAQLQDISPDLKWSIQSFQNFMEASLLKHLK